MCDCIDGPTPVTDWASGEVVCCACGVVTEGYILDDAPLWRDDEEPRRGPPRGGPPPAKRPRVPRDDPDPALRRGLALVQRFVGNLGLSSTCAVAGTAKELFTDVLAARGPRTDNRDALAAAAVYYGCRLENAERELRLIIDVCGVEARAMHAAADEFKDLLGERHYHARLFGPLRAGLLVDVFLDRLRLPPETRKRVWRDARALDAVLLMDCGRKPRTLCSGILFLAAERHGVAKKDVAEACDVCQQTLDKVVAQIRKLHPRPPGLEA
jgi:transcription initiation factor TFIIIB Brf1 subunit/transcription initiation factor TFIIB